MGVTRDMAAITLETTDRDLLAALLRTHSDHEPQRYVTGEAIAAQLDQSPGNVRNRIRVLVQLGLAESKAGPNGGYRPTQHGREYLDADEVDARLGTQGGDGA